MRGGPEGGNLAARTAAEFSPLRSLGPYQAGRGGAGLGVHAYSRLRARTVGLWALPPAPLSSRAPEERWLREGSSQQEMGTSAFCEGAESE